MVQTDLLQATKQDLPLFELLNADNNFVSCSFRHLLKKERGKSFCVNIASLEIMMCRAQNKTGFNSLCLDDRKAN